MTDCKTCSKCGEVKAVSEFYSGRARPCKKCISADGAAYCKANPEKVVARSAAYRKANHEKAAAYKAAYRKENPEKHAAKNAAWGKANPEKVAAIKKSSVLEMRPAYIAGVIGLPTSHLTPELLALKREQLTTHRLSKQITQAIKAQGAPA